MFKKLFLLVLVAASLSNAFGARYKQEKGFCHFYGTEQDLFNGEKQLDFDLEVEYILAFNAESGEFLASRQSAIRDIQATTPVSIGELQDVASRIEFTADGEVVVDFDSNDVNSLMKYMGAYIISANGLSMPGVSGMFSVGSEQCLQSHQEPGVDSGVSYHLCFVCETESSDNTTPVQNGH